MTTEEMAQGEAAKEQATDGSWFARRALDALRADGRDWIWTLENGIEIRCTTLPITYLAALRESMPAPKPPKVPGAGGELEEVPDHPDFIRALAQYSIDFEAAQNRLIYGLATSIERLPEGFSGPDEDGWLKQVQRAEKLLGGKKIDVEIEDPDLRYVDWLRYYAADNERDAWVLNVLPQRLAGLTLSEVSAAAESFRRHEAQRTHNDGPALKPAADGDSNHQRQGRSRR